MTNRELTILVVDDDANARLVMTAAMRKAGFTVRTASGGHDALESFRAAAPDLVMLDVEMPDLDGYEVCRLLRAEAGPLLPVLMVTGMDDVTSVETAYDCGATDFISKPVNWALIGYRVRYLLRSHKAMLALKSAEARISKLAYFDSLTNLPNRHTFLNHVDSAIQEADEPGSKLAVLCINLDNFKTINDTLGHAAGDQLLKEAASRFKEALRQSDLVLRSKCPESIQDSGSELARLGGDEFTVLLRHVKSSEAATAVAKRIGKQIRRPFVLEGRGVTVTASIGISIYPEDGQDGAALLKHADTAMYHAKRTGRDSYEVYTTSLTHEIVQRAELEHSLRLALERSEFNLVYQPKVDVASGRVLSVEALLRWVHPERGMISPVEFIPLAEQTGLIESIGRWVLETACIQAVDWARAGMPITVAVNLSPLQIANPDLPQHVLDVLEKTGLTPELLELEVTEGILMQNTELTSAALDRLRSHGVRIALDDFGTGYSSLAYLTRFPIDNIKIDRCFVSSLDETHESAAIVRAVIAIARSLGMVVTAEGVETLEQADALHMMGCDSLQGYYFSRPISAELIPAELAKVWQKSSVVDLVEPPASQPRYRTG